MAGGGMYNVRVVCTCMYIVHVHVVCTRHILLQSLEHSVLKAPVKAPR